MSSPWNHGKISRNEAEQLLVANGKNGAFLVRQSESVIDAHVLSLWFDGMVHHFRILKNENVFVVQASSGGSTRLFSTLEEVIELFKQPGQGLPHELREPIINDLNNIDNDLDHDTDEEQDPPNQDMISCEGFSENPEYTNIGSFFINKLEDMDTSGLDSDFCKNVLSYLNGGFERDGEKIIANKPPTDLQELIVNSAESVQRELKNFLKKIMFLQQLLCANDDLKKLVPGVVSCGSSARQPNEAYDDLVEDLARCVAGIKSLKMLAQKAHQERANPMKDEQSQTKTFEVTSCGNFKTNKSYLKVDITEGNIWFMKNENDSIDDSTVVEHDKILQLVKDPDTPKLTFKIAKGNREYLFKDIQAREHLCQLTQHMMNIRDPTKKEPKQISIFVGTWNMGSASPQKIESWLKCNGTGATINDVKINEVVGHDIYAIGTQESSIGEATWISKIKMELKRQFKVDYYPVSTQSLWGIRLVILVKPEHKNRISRVEKSSVKTGIANTLGNKGGVGISFDFLSTSLCFINCHLTSGNEDLRKERRRQNYLDILKGLSLGHKNAYDLTNQFHHVFWFGDLNYRIDLPYEEIIPAIKAMDFKKLSSEDQLKKERDTGNVFVNFHETVPHFPPTYRYKRGTREMYEHIKVKRAGNRINVPSWCDRVLWRSFPDLDVKQNSYGCTDDIVSSDHSPVFASFDVPIISQFVDSPARGRTNSQAPKPSCKINIPWIKVKVNTVSKTEFYLEFHSVCLATSVKSKTGKKAQPWDPPRAVNSKPTLTSYSEWTDTLFPELNPILDNPEYLREQHILIAVKSEAGDESYGECVVSLRGHIFNTPQTFNSDLTHGGIWSGELRGIMNVLNIKQAAHLRRPPPVHAKPDLISGQNAVSPKVPHRPVSCLAPNVRLGGTIPPPRTSASLGRRQPPLTKRKSSGSVTTQANITNISTYIMLPNISSGTTSNNTGEDLTTTDSTVPPPLPAKTKKEPTVPNTVDQFLSKLGLSCYLQNLEDNGFDHLTFLDNISDEDLADSGITDNSHVKLILDEVENLRKVGVFNTE